MNYPLISIITPSFNQGKYIEATIQSVHSQNYPRLEFFVMDGGSTDETKSILQKYDSKITKWVSEKDNGQSDAINKGFRLATGDIVTWLNSDDEYLPETLHKVAELFNNHPQAQLVFGSTLQHGPKFKSRIHGAPAENIEERCLAYIPFPQPSSFFRKKVLDNQGLLNESLHYGMDFDLLVRIVLNYDIFRSDEVFSKYLIHDMSKSNVQTGFIKDWCNVFSKVLRSLPDTQKNIEVLKLLELYIDGNDKYSATKIFKADQIQKSFYYFLQIQMHYHYDALLLKKSANIAKHLLQSDASLQIKSEAKKILFRSRNIRPAIIQFLRKIKR